MSTTESDNGNDPQPVRRSKQSEKKNNSENKKFDYSKFVLEQDEEDDDSNASSNELSGNQLRGKILMSEEEEGSLVYSPQRRLPEAKDGSRTVCSPEPALGPAPISPQASAEALALSQALERDLRSVTSSRDGLALEQIKDKNTIIELKDEIRRLERARRSDHSGFPDK